MAARKLYALLVGINEYKRSLIPSLTGTHKDVANIQAYLQNTYRESFELDLQVLQDEAATRGNMIQGIEQHLGQAKEGDVAFFFFAGHGSWLKRNEFFEALDYNSQEKTLVCYDSRTSKKHDLSENELLVLFNYVGRNKATLLVVIDAAHATKFESAPYQTTRLFEGIAQPRKLEHYLYDTTVKQNKFYYYKEFLKYKELQNKPAPSYVCFSACDRLEYATENENGGWFTQGLIQALSNSQTPQTYFQVYNALLSAMVCYPITQTPIFEAYNKFDVHKIFLTGAPSKEKNKRFKITKAPDQTIYNIQFGAQLGFPIDLQRSISFNLFAEEQAKTTVGTGEVQFLGMKDSPIHLSLPSMGYQDHYWAELLDFTLTPLTVGFTGFQEDLDLLNQYLQQQDIAPVLFVPSTIDTPFYLKWEEAETCYKLYEYGRPVFLLALERATLDDPNLVELLLDKLAHLHQWRTTIALSNPKSALPKEDITLKFTTPQIHNTTDIQVVYTQKGEDHIIDLKSANDYPQKEYSKVILAIEEERSINYDIDLMNTSFLEDYYVAFLLISADYGVFPLAMNLPLAPRASLENIIDPNYGSLSILRESDTALKHYLKVIVSREKLPTIEGFMLSELPLEEVLQDQLTSRAVAPERAKIFDWQAYTLAICLEKKSEDTNSLPKEL
ncbi:MAG: caspase family protein [Aureispira sp.]